MLPFRKLAVFTTATSGVQPERASPRREFYLRIGLPILDVRRDHAAFVRQSKRGFLVLHDSYRRHEPEPLICGLYVARFRPQMGFAVGTEQAAKVNLREVLGRG